QPFLGEKQLRTPCLIGRRDPVLFEAKLRQVVLAERIGLDQRRHAIRKDVEKLLGERADMRADVEQRPRRIALEPKTLQSFLFHLVPVLRRLTAGRCSPRSAMTIAGFFDAVSATAMSTPRQRRSSARIGRTMWN